MINLEFSEDSEFWCNAWNCAFSVGGSLNDAEISAALAQWAFRDSLLKEYKRGFSDGLHAAKNEIINKFGL